MKKIGLLISTLVIGGSFYYRDVGAMMMLVIKRVKLPSIFLFGAIHWRKIRSIN